MKNGHIKIWERIAAAVLAICISLCVLPTNAFVGFAQDQQNGTTTEILDDNSVQQHVQEEVAPAINEKKAIKTRTTKASEGMTNQPVFLSTGTTPQTTPIVIDGLDKTEYKYGETISLNITGGDGGGEVSYESSNVTVATVSDVGLVTIVGTGKFIITVTKAGDDTYESASQPSAEITASKAIITVTPDSGQSKEVSDIEPVLTYTVSGWLETPTFTGELAREEGEVKGKYKINLGTLQIEDNVESGFKEANYELKCIDTVDFEIKRKPITEVAVLSSSSGLSTSGWYRDDITLSAPKGFKINLDGSTDLTKWYDEIATPYSKEGKDVEIKYYLKDDIDDEISKLKTIKYNLDKTAPTGTIAIGADSWIAAASPIDFKRFYNTETAVSITGEDKVGTTVNNDAPKIEYQLVNSDIEYNQSSNWNIYSSLNLSPTNKYIVYAKITDIADNVTYINSNGIIINNIGAEIKLTPDEANVNGLYNKDVNVGIDVTSSGVYAGLKTVKYTVKSDNVETQAGTLYPADSSVATDDPLIPNYNSSVIIDKNKNNSNNIILEVTATDNAGNVSTKTLPIKIDTTQPSVNIFFDNNDVKNTENGKGYFNNKRVATIKITERSDNFDINAARDAISIKAVDLLDKEVTFPDTKISAFIPSSSNNNSDTDVFTATITYDISANYSVDFTYTDKADNVSTAINYGTSVAPASFTVDTDAPTGTLTVDKIGIWDKLLAILTFGHWSKESVDVKIEANDITSPIHGIYYYKSSADTALDVQALEALASTDWISYTPFKVEDEQQFVLYAKIVDKSDNTTFISTNGIIIDKLAPTIDKLAPEINIIEPNSINGIHSKDFNVLIEVSDPKNGGINNSGIKSINYKLLNGKQLTQEDTLFTFNVSDPTQSQLVQDWKGAVLIDAENNSSNSVKLIVSVSDNAGNVTEQTLDLKIDTIVPTIEVEYDNNKFENTKFIGGGNSRKATITISELNLLNAGVTMTVERDGASLEIAPDFVSIGKDSNDVTNKWQMVIDYSKYGDGDYKFDVHCVDLVGNKSTAPKYNGNDAAVSTDTEFTIDNLKPTIEVSYDNNAAQNENYFNEVRTARINVVEHNWQASDFVIDIVAESNETGAYAAVDKPVISSWSTSGDTHTATVVFSTDARYSLSAKYLDLAKNEAKEILPEIFYIDRTMPIVPKNINEININNYVNGEGSIISPSVNITDNNYDPERVTITLTGSVNNAITPKGTWAQMPDGRSGTFNFAEFANEKTVDDIYEINISVTDKAGNTIDSGAIEFSVNRFGSTYDFKKVSKVKNGYFKNVDDLVFREVNPNKISLESSNLSLSRNGNIKSLAKDKDYTVTSQEQDGNWSEYTYTVSSKNYKEDGKYIVTLKSKDEANNSNSSDDETQQGAVVAFAVDNTKPEVAVSGVESNATYNTDTMRVVVAVSDNIKLNSAQFMLNGKSVKGNIVEDNETSLKCEIDVAGAFEKQSILITYNDEAGNNGEFLVDNFLVTNNALVRFYQNKPLFFGTIGTVALVALAGVALLIFKKNKAS